MKFAIWILAFTALLVEVLLQAGSLVVYLVNSQKAPASQQTQGKGVLCVGDSWTHGMGSTDSAKNSYPAVLQTLLQARVDPGWKVFNGGQSGQNSRDVLLRLESQLEEHKPSVVCVLVGRNDRWSTPKQVDSDTKAESHRSYRFRLRLPRLLAWIVENFTPQPAAMQTDGPQWRSNSEPYPNPYCDSPWLWPRNADGIALRQEGWKLLAENELSGALACFEKCLAFAPDPEVHGALRTIYQQTGQIEKANASVRWLEEEWSRAKTYWTGRQLMAAFANCSRDADTLAVCKEYLQLFPKDPIGWGEQGRAQFNLGQYMAAGESLNYCFAGYKGASFFATLRTKVAMSLQFPEIAIATLFEGYAANNDLDWIRSGFNLLTDYPHVTNKMMLDVLASFTCKKDVHERLTLLVKEAIQGRDGEKAKRVLMHHLGQIVSMCKAHHATPVFLEYPVMQAYHGVLAEAADDFGVPHIDIFAMFRKRMPEATIRSMRSPDGHVDDDGYRIMAECVFEGLQPVLQSLK